MKKKIILLSICGIIACGMFAGCGNKEAKVEMETEKVSVSTSAFSGEQDKSGEINKDVKIDLGNSELYSEEELNEAIDKIQSEFAGWAEDGCVLNNIRYAGDDANNEENLKWLNSLDEEANFIEVAEFLADFHSPKEAVGAWEADHDYKDYQWWLAREDGGEWQLLTWGY